MRLSSVSSYTKAAGLTEVTSRCPACGFPAVQNSAHRVTHMKLNARLTPLLHLRSVPPAAGETQPHDSKRFSRSILGEAACLPWRLSTFASLPPRGLAPTAVRAGGNRPLILGSVTTGKLSSHFIYFQFAHSANRGAGAGLRLPVNLPLTQDGDAIPKCSFKTRKQFNLRRPASPGGPAL